MSECTGPVTFELYDNMSVGSVGQCMEGVFLKVDQPDADGNGEVRSSISRYIYHTTSLCSAPVRYI
jgi:hypothetical protein